MRKSISFRSLSILLISVVSVIYACSKGGSGGTNPPPNPCNGVTISVSGTPANPTAPGATNGSISVTASGSSGFTFSINGGPFQASGNFTNLGAGSYTIVAKDGNGCTGSNSFILNAPNPCAGVTITVIGSVVNPTAGQSNGSITASASGGAGSFTYSLNGGAFQASGTFNNLAAGNYTVTAKDANGCTGSNSFTLTAPNPCTGVNITLSNVVAGNTPCQSPASGSITVTASGGTSPYTYQLNSGSFQSSNIFSNLVSGAYVVTVKDVNGCTGSQSNVLVSDLPEGPLFAAVRSVLQNNCVSCHNSGNQQGGMNWTIDCNIVQFKDRIQARAVFGNPSSMPPTGLMPASERQKITNWINAGGRYTD